MGVPCPLTWAQGPGTTESRRHDGSLGGEFESVETYFTLLESTYRLSLNVVVIDTFGGGVNSSPCHAMSFIDLSNLFVQPIHPTTVLVPSSAAVLVSVSACPRGCPAPDLPEWGLLLSTPIKA